MCICENCGKEHDGSYGSGRFCSCRCAKSFSTKLKRKEINERVSRTLKAKHDFVQKYCKLCGKPIDHRNLRGYCRHCKFSEEYRKEFPLSEESHLKLSAAARKGIAIQAETRRSKNEIAFCTLCEQYFSNVEHNVPIFNGWDADVIIHDIKYAVLWNGKWHYEKITADHSVEQVQNRDHIKMSEIIKCGYTPYIIKDVGKHKESFVREEFDKFIKLVSTKD